MATKLEMFNQNTGTMVEIEDARCTEGHPLRVSWSVEHHQWFCFSCLECRKAMPIVMTSHGAIHIAIIPAIMIERIESVGEAA